MSSLWTPSGEHPVDDERSRPSGGTGGPAGPEGPPGGADQGRGGEPTVQDWEEGVAESPEAVEELRRQLASTPAEVVVANHCYGMFELAAIYLSQQPPLLAQAQLAIDGLGALVEGLEGRLGEPEAALKDALAQIRLAYVQVDAVTKAADGNGGGSGADGNGDRAGD